MNNKELDRQVQYIIIACISWMILPLALCWRVMVEIGVLTETLAKRIMPETRGEV